MVEHLFSVKVNELSSTNIGLQKSCKQLESRPNIILRSFKRKGQLILIAMANLSDKSIQNNVISVIPLWFVVRTAEE